MLVVAWFAAKRAASSSAPPSGSSSPNAKASSSERARVTAALAELGWPAHEVDPVIQIESEWRPAARNPVSDASGLIQFIPRVLARLGFRPELEPAARAAAFRLLSADAQIPWILSYFRPMKWRRPGDTYVAVAASGHVGAPDDRIIYPIDSAAWRQNPAWREPNNGPITAGSIRRVLLRRIVT